MNPRDSRLEQTRFIQRTAAGVAVVAAIFSAVMAGLLLTNEQDLKSHIPQSSPTIERLVDQYNRDPADAQRIKEIRSLDLLARRAYFLGTERRVRGIILLFCGLIVLAASLKTVSVAGKRLPKKPGQPKPAAQSAGRILALASAAGVLLLCVILITRFSPYTRQQPADPPDSGNQRPETDPAPRPIPAAPEERWTNFRGPDGLGIARVDSVPLNWSIAENKTIRWKIKTPGKGYSSPVVWADRLFITAADEYVNEIYCFDAHTGKELWSETLSPADTGLEKIDVYDKRMYAAPTMAVNGARVFAVFVDGSLACLDMSGKIVWTRNLDVPKNPYGHASSLMIHDTILIVQMEDETSPEIIGMEAATGNPVWKIPRKSVSWATPVLINHNSTPQLIAASTSSLAAYDPATGKKYWEREKSFSGEVATSPAYTDGRLFIVSVDLAVLCLKLGDSPDAMPEHLWTWEDEPGNIPSPVAANGLLVVASDYGTVTCIDANTGKTIRAHETNAEFYASPIIAGNHVFLPARDGKVFIFTADRTFDMVRSIDMGQDISATPAFTSGRIYIRGQKHLFCIGTDQ